MSHEAGNINGESVTTLDPTYALIESQVASKGGPLHEEADSEILPGANILDSIPDRITRRLLDRDVLTQHQVRLGLTEWKKSGEKGSLWRVIAKLPDVKREAIFKEVARTYAFAELEPDARPDIKFAKRVVDELTQDQRDLFMYHEIIPVRFEVDPGREVPKLILGSQDPSHPAVMELSQELGVGSVELRYAPPKYLDDAVEQVYPKRNEFLERVREDRSTEAFDIGATYEDGTGQLVDQEALDAEINRSALINLFEASLVEAVRMGASDIHIFPNKHKQVEFHFRIDGELQLWETQSKVHPEAMIAVAKDRCGNIDRFEREAAQDGYIQRTVDDTLIRYRVSVLPIASSNRDVKSESIVIRVLDDRNVFNDLAKIGLLEGALNSFQKAIKKPNGMVIMTGPTGSGKSTTLVAALHQVVRPQINVLTVEDPVEYIIPDVRQIKLGSRLDLSRALRSILRHDPDVVMVGEMRDKPTAELAIKLANTGHLTFSTLHTNDAPSAVSRLYKMDIEPFLIAYAINLIVAQRLIRKLCPACKRVDKDPDKVLMEELGFAPEDIESGVTYKPTYGSSCKVCRGVGYKGRRAIAEALYFTRQIRHIIVSSGESVDEDKIRDTAVKEGMLTLLASAREVVRLGDTSVEEVVRVTASDE